MPRTGQKAKPRTNPRYNLPSNKGGYSNLTEELLLQIEQLVKEGKRNVEIYETLNIPMQTWYTWLSRNTNQLEEKVSEWRQSYMLKQAEQKLAELVDSKDQRISLEASKYLTERLNKSKYSNRDEHKVIDMNEGKTIEPENKERLDKLLMPTLSPIQVQSQ